MVVGLTTTCAINAYDHYHCEFEPCSWQGVLDTTLCDKVCDLRQVGGFLWLLQLYICIEISCILLSSILIHVHLLASYFMQFVTPVRHNQQNLSKRTDLRLVFCNRKLMRTDIFFHWVLQGIFLKR